MTTPVKGFVRYLRNIKAVSALEYAILVGAVAVAMAAAAATFSDDIQDALNKIAANVKSSTKGVGNT